MKRTKAWRAAQKAYRESAVLLRPDQDGTAAYRSFDLEIQRRAKQVRRPYAHDGKY